MLFEVTDRVATRATLSDYTGAGLIVPRLQERDSAGVIGELSRSLRNQELIPDLLPFYQAAINREVLQDSALDAGLAVPHVRLPGNRKLCFALGRTPEPISWTSRHSRQVDLIFLLAVPATDAAEYLPLLAAIAGLGQNPRLLAQLRAATTVAEMLRALEMVKV